MIRLDLQEAKGKCLDVVEPDREIKAVSLMVHVKYPKDKTWGVLEAVSLL